MNRKQKRRMFVISGIFVVVLVIISLALLALRNNIDLYFTPSELRKAAVSPTQRLRIGGWVADLSIRGKYHDVYFNLTDHKQMVSVHYRGLLPSLFRVGQGIVIEGKQTRPQHIEATQVLAKHDENYHPPKLIQEQVTHDH